MPKTNSRRKAITEL